MKIRILSDLHLDVNSKWPMSLADKDTFTILCGDVSGDPKITTEWIKENVHHGVFVAGNHLVYNRRGKTIDELREEMYEADTGDCTYLDCMVQGCPVTRQIDYNTVIVGSTMYTDFKLDIECREKLSEDMKVTRNKYISERGMNDYHWGRVRVDAMRHRALCANDYEKAFNKFMYSLKIIVEEIYPNKDIIVVTHHCPSKKCISESYVDSDINASYVSDLDDFIISHPNIKLWACGHVHHQTNFKIGGCRVVINPRGYVAHCEDARFDSRLYVDTEDWKVRFHKKTKAEQEDYDKRRNEFMRFSAWFI